MKDEKDRYNPYQDESIHLSVPDWEPDTLQDRSGFNDVIRHYDIVNGHQMPKKLDHLPKKWRKWFRGYIIIWVGAFFIYLIRSVIQTITSF